MRKPSHFSAANFAAPPVRANAPAHGHGNKKQFEPYMDQQVWEPLVEEGLFIKVTIQATL